MKGFAEIDEKLEEIRKKAWGNMNHEAAIVTSELLADAFKQIEDLRQRIQNIERHTGVTPPPGLE